jgi:hypothetical protein
MTDSLLRPLAKITTLAGLCALLLVGGCKRNAPSKTRIDLRDVPEASSRLQAADLTCPPGDPTGNDAMSVSAGGHTVDLRWNASSSVRDPHHKEVSYCIYRTAGHPVQPSTIRSADKSPCVNCQRVTIQPISQTTYRDTRVENNVHYCYVAIAVESGNLIPSAFSNQADAVVPPRREAPFCNAAASNAGDKKKRGTRHR